MAKKGELKQSWHVIDVTGKVLGRAAARIAMILMGKHRPEYTPHVDTGEFVIVINAAKVKVTGEAKLDQRNFERYSKYPGGRKVIPLRQMLADKPEFVIKEAVRRMVPKTKLGKTMMSKLKVYAGSEHPHQAQQPSVLEI
jgi:large subunit ribosomal protein L13